MAGRGGSPEEEEEARHQGVGPGVGVGGSLGHGRCLEESQPRVGPGPGSWPKKPGIHPPGPRGPAVS